MRNRLCFQRELACDSVSVQASSDRAVQFPGVGHMGGCWRVRLRSGKDWKHDLFVTRDLAANCARDAHGRMMLRGIPEILPGPTSSCCNSLRTALSSKCFGSNTPRSDGTAECCRAGFRKVATFWRKNEGLRHLLSSAPMPTPSEVERFLLFARTR